MRRRGDRRLTDIIVAIERRTAARRDHEIQRRAIEDRRKLDRQRAQPELEVRNLHQLPHVRLSDNPTKVHSSTLKTHPFSKAPDKQLSGM